MPILRSFSVAAFAVTAIARTIGAQDGPLDSAAAALDVDAVKSPTSEASGRYHQWGQAPAPELHGTVQTLDALRAASGR